MGMDELAYARYLKRADRADETYKTIRELYGWEIPWNKSYFMAIKDKLLTKEDNELVKEFHPINFRG